MKHYGVRFVLQLISLYLIEAAAISSYDEYLWINSMGNARNTRRLVPSSVSGYNGNSWNYVYNSSSQDAAVYGVGVGVNGDLYSFLSISRYSSGMF